MKTGFHQATPLMPGANTNSVQVLAYQQAMADRKPSSPSGKIEEDSNQPRRVNWALWAGWRQLVVV